MPVGRLFNGLKSIVTYIFGARSTPGFAAHEVTAVCGAYDLAKPDRAPHNGVDEGDGTHD